MKSVMFNFVEQASEDSQERLRRQVLDMPGVKNVVRLNPDARNPRLRRMWFAEVVDDASADALVRRLQEHQDIQATSLPALRSLM